MENETAGMLKQPSPVEQAIIDLKKSQENIRKSLHELRLRLRLVLRDSTPKDKEEFKNPNSPMLSEQISIIVLESNKTVEVIHDIIENLEI